MFLFFVVIVFWVDVYRCRYLNVYIYMYIYGIMTRGGMAGLRLLCILYDTNTRRLHRGSAAPLRRAAAAGLTAGEANLISR